MTAVRSQVQDRSRQRQQWQREKRKRKAFGQRHGKYQITLARENVTTIARILR